MRNAIRRSGSRESNLYEVGGVGNAATRTTWRVAACIAAISLLALFPRAPSSLAQTASPCAVTSANVLSVGDNQDWSRALDLIAYDKADSTGTHQLYTIRPDGTSDTCLSCVAKPGGPAVDRHKLMPTWSADGKWIIVQAENNWHPYVWFRTSDSVIEQIINGMATQLYAVSADGQQWQKLTNYGTYPVAPDNALGAMSPHFSPDGTKVIWSKLVSAATASAPWGIYRLMMASFVIAGGVPTFQNVTDITPAGATPFVEAHGLSPDGRSALYTSYASASDANNMDVYTMDLATRTPVRLTTSPLWDEHASFSLGGQKIVYMAGELGVWSMSADLMIMDVNGANKHRLTSFNQSGQPGYSGELTMVMRPSWNPAGTRMAVTEQLATGYPGRRRLSVVTFAGACGGP